MKNNSLTHEGNEFSDVVEKAKSNWTWLIFPALIGAMFTFPSIFVYLTLFVALCYNWMWMARVALAVAAFLMPQVSIYPAFVIVILGVRNQQHPDSKLVRTMAVFTQISVYFLLLFYLNPGQVSYSVFLSFVISTVVYIALSVIDRFCGIVSWIANFFTKPAAIEEAAIEEAAIEEKDAFLVEAREQITDSGYPVLDSLDQYVHVIKYDNVQNIYVIDRSQMVLLYTIVPGYTFNNQDVDPISKLNRVDENELVYQIRCQIAAIYGHYTITIEAPTTFFLMLKVH